VSGSVVVAGVEQRDAGVERRVDRGDALALLSRPYRSDMPMQPRPSGKTRGPCDPSWRD
jgi:hypothetical protein